jgi:hypothetical protein
MKQVSALLEKIFPLALFEIWERVLWLGNLKHTIFKCNANPIDQILTKLKFKSYVREMQKHITYVAAYNQTHIVGLSVTGLYQRNETTDYICYTYNYYLLQLSFKPVAVVLTLVLPK